MPAEYDSDDPITVWLQQVKECGDEKAFEQIWSRYFANLVRLARKNLADRPARFADEDDIVQSALASFFFRAKKGLYPDLNDRDGLWKLLISTTLTRIRALARKEGRRSEILEREFAGKDFLKGEPSPEFAVEMRDQLDRLMSRLDDELTRRVAVAKLEGFTNREIAQRISKSIPTVERKLRRIRSQWEG